MVIVFIATVNDKFTLNVFDPMNNVATDLHTNRLRTYLQYNCSHEMLFSIRKYLHYFINPTIHG